MPTSPQSYYSHVQFSVICSLQHLPCFYDYQYITSQSLLLLIDRSITSPNLWLTYENIYSSIHFLWSESPRGPQPILAITEREAGYTLDGSPVHHKAKQEQIRQKTSHAHSSKDSFKSLNNVTRQRKKKHAASWYRCLKQEPSSCEVTVLFSGIQSNIFQREVMCLCCGCPVHYIARKKKIFVKCMEESSFERMDGLSLGLIHPSISFLQPFTLYLLLQTNLNHQST